MSSDAASGYFKFMSTPSAAVVEMESMRRTAELDKKSYDDLVRERDILSKAGSRCAPGSPRRAPLMPGSHSVSSPGPAQGRGQLREDAALSEDSRSVNSDFAAGDQRRWPVLSA